MQRRVAIISSHPIQYNAPLFSLLSKSTDLKVKVFYTLGKPPSAGYFDVDFRINIDWDIPLFDNYEFCFLKNSSLFPGTHHFLGIINFDIFKALDDFKPDLIFLYGWNYFTNFRILFSRKISSPILFRGDSNLLNLNTNGIFKNYIKLFLLRFLFKRISLAFFCGTLNFEYFKFYGISLKKLAFMPHAIDNNRFKLPPPSLKEFKSSWGISHSTLVFLFAGKLELKKDPELLILSFIKANIPNSTLLIVGSGHLESYLKFNFSSYTNIIFIPFINQNMMPCVYHCCDVFVLPSSGPNETWGLAVNEAMASSKPVIVSNMCGCYPDLVFPGFNGFIFQSGSIDDLKSTLLYCASLGKYNLKNMGINSFKIIKNWNFFESVNVFKNSIAKIFG